MPPRLRTAYGPSFEPELKDIGEHYIRAAVAD
jgi:hypothetical protein